MKNTLSFLWAIVVGSAVYLLYKLFVKTDDELDITSTRTGLSKQDIEIFNKVLYNLNNGGNPNSLTAVLFNPVAVEYAKSAIELQQLLDSVQNKPLFAEVFAKYTNKTLTTTINDVYGEKIYNLIANNTTNFVEFII